MWAQDARAGGNGIRGDYYDGPEFERFVLSRRDPTLAFDWGHRPPAPGVPAEYFSVRWTGWLVPPASGRYVFHATVDDGIRIWLNDQLIMNEWRPQWVTDFTAAVNLKAGEPYKLRVDYFQDIFDTRLRVTWERPDKPLAPPPASWSNLWGMNAEMPTPQPIPTQFLFTRNPKPVPPTAVPLQQVVKTKPAPVAKAPAEARPQPAPKPKPVERPPAPLPRRAAAVPTLVKSAPVAIPNLIVADSGSTAQLARLGVGEAVTLPELRFEQGQAELLSAARAALDALAPVLSARPQLRFEVQGHTDNVGNAELNRQLSQQRAEKVCLYLTAHGVPAAQLRPVGFGGTQPVADNADPTQRPRNRRVVLQRL
ncbi:MAG TPA: PA14 domain-containing protein [Hymenobacter sp.]|jgi:outer membrane protein OmpA-like peptidoglycan-associated protein|uniref:PA14 domain-containing protein n=1 Tax=Hymenobacter sp. TaxID=1898978 RepID=UPI002EDA94F4